MKKIFTLIAMAVLCMTAFAESYTFNASSLGSANIANLEEHGAIQLNDYLSLQFYWNDVYSSTNAPQYPKYVKDGYITLYSKNSFVVTPKGAEITKITFECTSTRPSWSIQDAEKTSYSSASPSWTGASETALTFTGKSASDISSITIEYTIKQPVADDTSAGYLFFGENELKEGETARDFTRSIGNCSIAMKSSSTSASVDAQKIWFGTADDNFQTTHRWQPKTKSSATNGTAATITFPADGTFTVYARTASDSEDRTIVLTQDGNQILNKVLHESDAVQADLGAKDEGGNPKMSSIYPAVTVEVKKGTATLTWPVNAVFIYGYKYVSKFATEEPVNPLKTPTGIKAVNATSVSSNAAYNLAGQRVAKKAKGIIIKNGKKYVK